MKTKTKRIGITLASVLSASLIMGGSVAGIIPSKAATLDGVSFEAAPTQSNYVLNQTLAVPAGEFTYNGKQYPAESIVYTPSGDAFNVNETKLEETGKYTIEYRAVIDSHLVKEYRTFDTLESLYSAGSARSTMTYGKPVELGIPFTTEQSPAGLNVSLANGDVFTYNGVIDLNNSSRDRKTLEFYVTPLKSKAVDAFNAYVKFTDIYDPNNYVILSSYCYNMKVYEQSPCRATYLTACVPSIGQTYTGHYTTNKSTGTGYEDYIFKSMTTSGWCSFMSFYGDNANGDIYWKEGSGKPYQDNGMGFNVDWGYTGQRKLSLFWNYEEKALMGEQPLNFKPGYSQDYSDTIADFDSAAYYGSSLWDGFTTGECYVSMWAENYNGSSFNFCVTEVDGMDLTTTEPETTFTDTAAPRIDVNYGKYTKTTYPEGKVNCEYPVFEASGMDGYDGEVEVKARAFYGYNTADCYEVTCKDTFLPDRTGTFTIVYTAKDKMGNTTTEEVPVVIGDSATELTFSASTDDVPKTGVKSTFIAVPDATYSGGVGELTYTVTATNKTSGTEYVAKNGEFRPMEAGEYTVVCEVKDFIGQTQSVSYDVTVSEPTDATFVNLPQFPKYFISGYTYELPELKAINEADDSEVETKIYAVDGGARTELGGGIYNVDGDTRDIQIVYVAGTNELAFTVPVLAVQNDRGIIDGAAYFYGNGFTAKASSSNVVLTADSGVKNASATFANPVLAEGFQSIFNISGGEFDTLSMYITDSLNDNERIKFSWKKSSGVIFMYVNDKPTTVSTALDFAGAKDSNFSWNNETHTFTDIGTQLSVTVDETVYGEAFSGFSSGKVYMTLEMNDISGNAALTVKQINNQTIRTIRRDAIAAQFVLKGGSYIAKAFTGTKITLKDFTVADVLSPNVSVTLTVFGPDGETAVTNDAGQLIKDTVNTSGTFTLSEVGNYKIVYTVNDGNTNLEDTYLISVSLENQIEITLLGEMPTTGTVNQAIALPAANYVAAGGDAVGYVAYINTKGVIIDITSTRTFTPTEAGTYIVIYTAYDSSENVRTLTYRITVK